MNDTLFSLSGRTAMVTGASSGLGRAFASVLAAAGASVVLTGRRMELLEQACAEITSQGGEALAVNMDVTDEKNGHSRALMKQSAAAGASTFWSITRV